MENHFQTEAFNLDKVLDDFEQKQGESINRFNHFVNQSINPPIRFALTMLWSDSLPFSLCMFKQSRGNLFVLGSSILIFRAVFTQAAQF